MSSFQQNIVRQQRNKKHTQEKGNLIETVPEKFHTVDLLDKDSMKLMKTFPD